MEKLETGVRNFDRLLGGGLPTKQMILLEGAPGSGKSNLALEFLYRGAEKGQPGLYVSFQDTEDEILRSTTFSWRLERYFQNNTINSTKFDPYRYEHLPNMLRSQIKQNDAERVVLDPITDLDMFIDSRKDQRKNLMAIRNEIKELDSTLLMVAEKEEATELEEEVADGIIEMELGREGDRLHRKIFVRKLSGSDFNEGVHSYKFDQDGLKIE